MCCCAFFRLAVGKYLLVAIAFFCFFGLTISGAVASSPGQPTNTRIIDSWSQLGIDAVAPRFGWVDNDPDRGEWQSGYELILANNENDISNDLGTQWDSGQVLSSQQYGISYAGSPLLSTTKYWWKVRTWDKNGQVSPWSTEASFVTGFLHTNDWNSHAQWIGNPEATGPTNNPSPLFRKTFQITKPVVQAYLSVCGLGQSVVWLNGARVGTNVMDPAWTDYLRSEDYVTFDVTSQLQTGNNALGIMLGTGWFAYGSPTTTGTYFYGTMRVIAQLHVLYADGTSDDIATDPTWKTSLSPFTYTDVFGLENYDARLEQPGWNAVSFDDSSWSNAIAVAAPSGILKSQKCPPVVVHQVYPTMNVSNPSNNVYVFDLGQNINGQYAITVSGTVGTTVETVPGEWLDSNGRVKPIKSYTHSLYTLKGSGTEVWQLTFSTVGFRYIEVRNATRDVTQTNLPYIQAVTGYATYTAATDTGSFYASDDRYNQIYNLGMHTLQNELVSIHTDCPTWEKLGWQEVVADTFPSSMYLCDLQTLATKIAQDQHDGMRAEGYLPDIVPNWFSSYDPNSAYENAPSWGMSAFVLPWLIYCNYGDATVMQNNYGTMTNYLAYLKTKEVNGVVDYGLGDYLAPAGPQIPNVEGAAYVLDTRTIRDIAAALGYTNDANYYSNEFSRVQAAYNDAYFDPTNQNYMPMSQGNNAIPLAYGIVPTNNERVVVSALVQDIAQPQESTAYSGYYGVVITNHLTVGDVACTYLWRTLGNYGLADLVQTMIMQPTAPSYMYMVNDGQTTITEDWISPSSRSFDHDMYAGIIEWFYRSIGGISSTQPGYAEIQLKPSMPAGLTNVSCTYQCIRGMIQSSWAISNQGITWNIQIPVNSKAKVYIPITMANPWISESGTMIWQNGVITNIVAGVALDHVEGSFPLTQSFVVWTVGSGNYAFQWPISQSPATPSGLAAIPGNAQMSVSWNAVPAASGYNLRRAATSGGPYAIIASGLNVTAYTDWAVTNGTTYYYVISAQGSNSESVSSFEANATPKFPLIAIAGSGQVSLNWPSSPQATSYSVNRSTTTGGPYVTVASGLSGTNYLDSHVTNGMMYFYIVTAQSANPANENSMEATAFPRIISNPGFELPVVSSYLYNPTGSSWIFSGMSGIAANAGGFTINNSNAPEGVQVAFLQETGTISQTLGGLTPGTNYTITFSAAQRDYAQAGQTWQLVVNGIVIASYSPPESKTNYQDYSASFTATSAGETISFVGTDTHGGDNTVLLDNVRIASTPIFPPASLVANAGNGLINLAWSASLGAIGYYAKRATTPNGPFAIIAGELSATNYIDTSASNGIAYYYVVSAIDDNGNESTNSVVAGAMPGVIPNFGFEWPAIGTYLYNPSGGSWTFSGVAGNGSGISANNSGFTSGNPNAPQGAQVAFLQGSCSIVQALTSFIPGATYTVTFSAAERGNYNVGGQTWLLRANGTTIGAYSPMPSATNYSDYSASFVANAATQTLAFVGTDMRGGDNTIFIDNVRIIAAPPSSPTNLVGIGSNGAVNLSWSPAAGAVQYNLRRATTNTGPYAVVGSNIINTSYSDVGLTNGTIYYYMVSALNPGGEGPNSAAASATPIGPRQLIGPQIHLMPTGQITLTINTVVGWNYQLLRRDALETGTWVNIGNPVAGSGNLITFYDDSDPGTNKEFYRILLEEPQ